jgi:hypothetical protein
MKQNELLGCCWEEQTEYLKRGSWMKSVRDEVHQIALGDIWLDREAGCKASMPNN